MQVAEQANSLRVVDHVVPAAAVLGAALQDVAQGQAEAAALYAEFAIDLAAQSVRYALRAALGAMALQAEADQARAEEKALRG